MKDTENGLEVINREPRSYDESPNDYLRRFLDSRGIRHSWVAQQFGKHRTWTGKILNGTVAIKGQLKDELEKLLNIKF